jgi:hypothetical protein
VTLFQDLKLKQSTCCKSKHISIDCGEYAKAEESVLSLDLKMERIKAIQQEILHLEVFKKLGELPSATRLYYDNLPSSSYQ